MSQDDTPYDINPMINTVSQSFQAIQLLLQKQYMTEKELKILDQRIQHLEDDVTRSVITSIDFVPVAQRPFFPRLKKEEAHLEATVV